jgi:hypothetical protein
MKGRAFVLDREPIRELCSLSVPEESIMVRSVLEEAIALASISLFLATVAVWAQVLGML